MIISVNDKGIGVNTVYVWKFNKDTVKVLVDTKAKYSEVYPGGSYNGNICVELRIILMNDDAAASITLLPENEWESNLVNNCDYFMGSTRYGVEIVYIHNKICNKSIGHWESSQ